MQAKAAEFASGVQSSRLGVLGVLVVKEWVVDAIPP